MAFYEWRDELSVNIPSIDRQHQVLIGYINDLHDAVGSASANVLAARVLKKLVQYTTVHFLYEEMLFGAYNYPQDADHKASHQRFIDQIERMEKDCAAGDSAVAAKLLELLKSWLNHHILKDDMAYSAFLLEQGVQ